MISIYLTKYTDLQVAKEMVLSKYSEARGNTYSIDYLPNGAPQLRSNSTTKEYVSISHTDGLLAMAFSDDNVGIDVERADRQVSPKVCKSIEDWTRIEAYAKWTGLGLSKDMIKKKLPEDKITTKRYQQYVVSVCSDEKDFAVITLT